MRTGQALGLLTLLAACGDGFVPARVQAISAPSGKSYFAAAWPDDRRLDGGKLVTADLPLQNASDLARGSLITNGDRLVDGAGLSSPIYVPFTGAVDVQSLPATPEASLEADASVYLQALDAPDRTPLEVRFLEAANSMLPTNTLIARPVTGFPLREGTRYALIVRTTVKDTSGAAIGPDQAMWRALHGDETHYNDVRALHLHDVAIAVVFTTQTVVAQLNLLRDWAEAQPDPMPTLQYERVGPSFWLYQGSYKAPYLLHGQTPYTYGGGELRFDAAGAPIVAKVEDLRLSLCVPRSEPPANGFPVVMYSHGTGGDYESVIGDICEPLAQLGIASVGIDQVLHGPRGGGGSCLGMSEEVCFFNPLNPIAIRNLPRQTVIDHVTLKKALGRIVLPAAPPLSVAVKLDAGKVGFFGHSQGGTTGALYSAVDRSMMRAPIVLSGAGGHLTTTVLLRKDPLDFKALAEGPLLLNLPAGETLDVFHPALAVVQALAEAADPLSYTPAWLTRAEAAKDMYVSSGGMDPYTPALGALAMAASAGIPELLPAAPPSPAYQLRGLTPVPLPRQGSGLQTFASEGHFAAFTDASIRQWRQFFHTLFSSGVATIPPLQ